MSTLSDQFQELVNNNLPDNGTKQILAAKHREVETFVKTNAVWKDEPVPFGFGARWTFLAGSLSAPSSEGFNTNSTTVSSITNVYLHRNSIDTEFNNTINSINGISISDTQGNKFVFEITSVEQETSYLKITGTAKTGTLTTLIASSIYTLGFFYGDNTTTIPNYFCTSWADVKSAVALCNAANGGNIYMSGDIILTEDVTWDVTNISFFGSTNCRWRVLNQDFISDGSTAYQVTISEGSTSFSNVQFRGSGGGASNQTFSTYSSRKIFKITSGDSDMTFNTCLFKDIIGGSGSIPQIEYTSISANTGSEVNFNGCTMSSSDSGGAFAMLGFTISTLNHSGNLSVSAINQKLPIDRTGTSGTDLGYFGYTDVPANVVFYTDGTAIGLGDYTSTNSTNPVYNSETGTIADDDQIWYRDDTTGRMVKSTMLALKTYMTA